MEASGTINWHFCDTRGNDAIGFSNAFGGALYARFTTYVNIYHSQFERSLMILGASHAEGGAVWLQDQSEVTIRDSSFTEHNATVGGAIYLRLSYPALIERCSFLQNDARQGGAIAHTVLYSPVLLTVRETNFTKNRGTTGGSALWTDYPLSLDACKFGGNAAALSIVESEQSGDASFWYLVVDKCVFEQNRGAPAIVSVDTLVAVLLRDCHLDDSTGAPIVAGGLVTCTNNSAETSSVYGDACGSAAVCEATAFSAIEFGVRCSCNDGYEGDATVACSRLPSMMLSEDSFNLFVTKEMGAQANANLFLVNSGEANLKFAIAQNELLSRNVNDRSLLSSSRWSASPMNGVIAPFQMLQVSLVVAPIGLRAGSHLMHLSLVSNDWNMPHRGVNVTVTVITHADANHSLLAPVNEEAPEMIVGGTFHVNITPADLDGIRVRAPSHEDDVSVSILHSASSRSYSRSCELGYAIDAGVYIAICSLDFESGTPRAGRHLVVATMGGVPVVQSPLIVEAVCPVVDLTTDNTSQSRICSRCGGGSYTPHSSTGVVR